LALRSAADKPFIFTADAVLARDGIVAMVGAKPYDAFKADIEKALAET